MIARRLSWRYACSKVAGMLIKLSVHPPPELFETKGYLHPVEARFLTWLAGRVPVGGIVLEVGSFYGRSSGFLAHGLPNGSTLVCVDTWNNDAMPYDRKSDIMAVFLENMKRFEGRYQVRRGRSVEVASTWKDPIAGLFIDGDHSYEGYACDLSAWLPHVRPGGWVALHDSGVPAVAQAIRECFPPSQRLRVPLQVWSIFACRRR